MRTNFYFVLDHNKLRSGNNKRQVTNTNVKRVYWQISCLDFYFLLDCVTTSLFQPRVVVFGLFYNIHMCVLEVCILLFCV